MGQMKEQELEEQQKQEKKEVLTEVTTIAKEEEKTGQKINLPTPEELVANASGNMIRGKKELSLLLPKLGKKALQRVILAGMDLPAEKIPVRLISKEEKYAFGIIQNMISSRFLIMQHHISQELQKQKEANSCKETKSSSQSAQAGSKKETKDSTLPVQQAEKTSTPSS